MTRTRRWITPACFLLSIALASGACVFASEPAEPPAGKAAQTGAAKSPSRPVQPEQQRQVVHMELAGQDDPEPKLGYGTCQWLYPLDAAPKKLLQEPKYRSAKPIYYAARFGDAKDNVFIFVIDESRGTGKGYDVVYVDANNDNRIDPEKERFDFRLSTISHDEPLRIGLLVTAGGVTAPYYVNFTAFPYSDDKNPAEKIHANLRNSSYYKGEAVLLDKRRKIAIADLNSNGLFNDVERGGEFKGDRFFVDLDDTAGAEGREMKSFPYGRYTRIGGTWYSIVASPDGSLVEITNARPALGDIKAPSHISAARLVSPTQPLDLKFTNGADSAVAGEYRVQHVELLAEGERPGGRTLYGWFPERGNKLTVREGRTAQLVAGLPLKIEPQVAIDEDRTLQISLRIIGAGGESYRWRPPAGFEIVDASGKQIASGDFEDGPGSLCLCSWRAPRDLNGVFRIVPKIDLTSFEHEMVEHRIRLRDGLLVEGAVPSLNEGRHDPRPAPSPAKIQEAIRIDQHLLQGTWLLTSATAKGRSGDLQGSLHWRFTGDKMVIELNGRWEGKLKSRAEFYNVSSS